MDIKKARILLKTNYWYYFNNSIKKAKALNNKADYIGLGANSSKTKKVKFKATIKDLKKLECSQINQ